jgi:hypothetical protein
MVCVPGCSPNDSDQQVRKAIVGAWKTGHGGELVISPDGTFHSHFVGTATNLTKEWDYSGTWYVENGVVNIVITNASTINTTNMQPIGSVDKIRILALSESKIIFESAGRTNTLTRKR